MPQDPPWQITPAAVAPAAVPGQAPAGWTIEAAAPPPTTGTGAPPQTGSAGGGFLSSLANALGIRHPIDSIVGVAKIVTEGPAAMAQQYSAQATDALMRAHDAYKRRDTQGAIRAATDAIPLIGPTIGKGQDQVAAGNLRGAAGTTLGAVLPLAASMPTVSGAADAVLAPVKTGVENAAVRTWTGAAKPVIAQLKKTNEYQAGEPMTIADQAVARTTLGTGKGRISAGNATALSDLVDSLEQSVTDKLKSSTGMVPRQDLEDALVRKANDLLAGTNFQFTRDEVMGAMKPLYDKVMALPDRVPVAAAQAIKVTLRKGLKFGPGETNTAETSARKGLSAEAAQSISGAEPTVAPLNQQMSELIPARDIMDRAALNAGRRNVIGTLGDTVAAASGRPKLSTAMTILSRPGMQSGVAQQMWNYAQMIPDATLRAALLSLMAKSGANAGGGR
jgi:hypothetical protein